MSYTVYEGSAVKFYTSTPFTSISGTVVNPDIVTFTWGVQGQTATTYTWTNPTGDPTAHIINDSTGNFHVTLPTTGFAGTWRYRWYGYPSGGTDVTATEVAFEGEVEVSASSF